MKNVVITGATSMLGLSLIDECIRNKAKVVAIVRNGSAKRHLVSNPSGVTFVECDLSKLSDITNETQSDFDAFYHFAWEATATNERQNVDAQYRNIGYTLDALQLAHSLGCKKFIGAGSQAEYGRVEGVISPETNVAPDTAYGVAKYSAGRLCAQRALQLDIGFIWARVFSIYGINDMPSTMVMYCIDSLLKGEKPVLTRCEQQWDYLNCRDAARALYLLGLQGKSQNVYNIGSGVARPLLEYVSALRDAINPYLPLGVGEREYSHNQIMHLCADISKLAADIGFKPEISSYDGIRETIRWYRYRK